MKLGCVLPIRGLLNDYELQVTDGPHGTNLKMSGTNRSTITVEETTHNLGIQRLMERTSPTLFDLISRFPRRGVEGKALPHLCSVRCQLRINRTVQRCRALF